MQRRVLEMWPLKLFGNEKGSETNHPFDQGACLLVGRWTLLREHERMEGFGAGSIHTYTVDL